MTISMDSIQMSSPKPPRSIVYGVQGIGKSTLGTRYDKPIFLCVEDGLAGLPDIAHWNINSFNDLMEAFGVLYQEQHDFHTVVLDTVSSFEPLLHAELMRRWNVDSLERVGVNGGGYFKWRVESLGLWQEILEPMDALRDRGMQIVLIGHSTDKEVNPPDNDPYRKYTIDLLNPKAVDLLFRWADIVAFCNYRVYTAVTKETVIKGKTKKTSRALEQSERMMFLSERPAWYAKNRYALPEEVPMEQGKSFDQLIEGT